MLVIEERCFGCNLGSNLGWLHDCRFGAGQRLGEEHQDFGWGVAIPEREVRASVGALPGEQPPPQLGELLLPLLFFASFSDTQLKCLAQHEAFSVCRRFPV